MKEIISNSIYFGVVITIFAYYLGYVMCKKLKWKIVNPLIISSILIISFLLLFKIEFKVYEKSANYITYLLTPTTICLAVPLYRQISILKKNFMAIIMALLCGCIGHLVTMVIVSMIFGMDEKLLLSILSKSVTMPIAIDISTEIGGVPALTIIGVILAGMIGATLGPVLLKFMKIKDPIAQGLAIGCASHALGTTKAVEIGGIQGAMSSLAIVVTGLLTVVVVQIYMMF